MPIFLNNHQINGDLIQVVLIPSGSCRMIRGLSRSYSHLKRGESWDELASDKLVIDSYNYTNCNLCAKFIYRHSFF